MGNRCVLPKIAIASKTDFVAQGATAMRHKTVVLINVGRRFDPSRDRQMLSALYAESIFL